MTHAIAPHLRFVNKTKTITAVGQTVSCFLYCSRGPDSEMFPLLHVGQTVRCFLYCSRGPDSEMFLYCSRGPDSEMFPLLQPWATAHPGPPKPSQAHPGPPRPSQAHFTCPDMNYSAFMMVNTSGCFAGQKALLFTPQLKENDTHCVIFEYFLSGREGAGPGQLNMYIRENNSPLGMPVWNVSGPATRDWVQVELAISTYWPNFYQMVFEVVTSGHRGLLAIKDVVLQGHQCMNTPHFLTIKGVEVNAGQTAAFHCTVNGRQRDTFNLWLQGIGGREAPMKSTKPWNNRRFIGTFDVENTTKGDSGRYRCIVHSDNGVGVSNYGELTIKQPPVPIAPPQLTAVGATYMWIQLNANSINGDGPIIDREVEYRTVSGTMYDLQPVDKTTHKIGHLTPDTDYEISVLLTRPLDGGTGAPGPPLRARTKCAEPIHGPRRLEVVDVQSKQVTVRWEPFGYNVTRCHSYNLTVQYRSRVAGKDETREEVCYDTLGRDPQHTIHNLTPYTNLSVKLVLKNPEGVKESREMALQTDEDVPGAVPLESIQGSAYEEKIIVKWREPAQTYGIITQYEISFKAVSSFDPELDLSNQSGKVLKHVNESSHIFLGLYPGSTYSFTLRASTAKGYGPPVITQFTTKISAPSMPAYDQETSLNQTDSTVTVLLKPAQSRGAPVSVYQVVVEEERPRRARRGAVEILRCYPVPIHFQNSTVLNSQYYFTAEFPAVGLQAPQPFTVGDNKTYSGYWNAPLLPQKSYSIYYQAVSTANGETKIDCVRVATKAAILVTQLTTPYIRIAPAAGDDQLTGEATHKPDAVEPEKQTDNTVKITGVIAGILLFVIIFLGVILLLKKRRTYHSYTYYLKLAKKRKETLSSTRQEMTVMVNSMDKSYTEQGTNCDEALSFMDTHSQTLNTRSECTLTLNGRSECTLAVNGRSECTLAVNGRTASSPSSFTLNKSNTLNSTLPKSYYPDPFVPTAILVPINGKSPALPGPGLGLGLGKEVVSQEHTDTNDSQTMGGGGGSCSDTSSLVQSHGHSLRKREGTVDTPYQTGQLHPAIRVADLLQHITQMKCAEGYGFKEEYEVRENITFDLSTLPFDLLSLNLCELLCPQYWPENGVHRHGPIQVEFVSADLEEDIISRIFRIYNAARPQDGYRMVQQFQFLGWPMYRDTPMSKRSFLKLIRQVDKWQEEYDGGEGRTVVHCLNGGGRSGTFCAISIVCEMLQHQRSVDVFHAVKTLRNNKPNMVDLLDQYKFCYEVALEYLNCG
ncbi:receptor-type tyrosine-protein phosphatase mu-like [Salmo trutta]|uniref:receptor-type tyrosine-protein phosphatase mu-like n=1 Tax=Salmo trutta TaxID=8032 RepID=UPI00112FD884|nr:receptor-type tyrosine-protein phosphatase mu-like [Salmo trutta]